MLARRAPLWVSLAVVLPALRLSCSRQRPELQADVLVVSQEQQAAWVRNFNPLTTATAARWPTVAGVYEPLFVFNSVKGQMVPWLAVSQEWREANMVLRVTTRAGVRWSDGRPFTAHDVAFTFDLRRRYPPLDRRGVWGFLAAVGAADEATVDFRFARRFIPGADEIAARASAGRVGAWPQARSRPRCVPGRQSYMATVM